MIYTAKHSKIEAEKVLLGGTDLVAVAVDGSAHLVDGNVFRLFFDLAPGRECFGERVPTVSAGCKKPGPKPKKHAPAKRTAVKRIAAKKETPAAPAHVGVLASGRRVVAEKNGKPTLSGLIRKALADGPKDLAQIVAFITEQDAGIPVDDRKISNTVYQMAYVKNLERVGDGQYTLPGGDAC